MLIEFSITNFLSFKDKSTFTMKASSDDILSDNYVEKGSEKLLKISALYGANASGKSNLFKIFYTIGNMLRYSNYFTPEIELPIVPFKLDKDMINKPSEFEIKFLIGDIRYVYGFKADKTNIYEEYLTYYPNGRPVKIFTRKNTHEYSFNTADEKQLKDLVNKNASNKFFLATAVSWNYEKCKPVYDFITSGLRVVMSLEDINNYSFSMYANDQDKTLEKFALRFLKKADINIDGYNVIEENMNEEQVKIFPQNIRKFIPKNMPMFRADVKHVINEEEYIFDIAEESLGTQVIFAFIPIIKDTLDNGKVLIIDEFDKSLHPYITEYIIEIFNDTEINKNGAQLIFNTHDISILNLETLRRDQIWFTEKDYDTAASILYGLDDFSVRKNENVEKGYMLGRYGAVPFLDSKINLLK